MVVKFVNGAFGACLVVLMDRTCAKGYLFGV